MMTINFDMDGTIADLYGVENWLFYLEHGMENSYRDALPLVNLSRLARYIHKAQTLGYEVNILSWLAKNSNDEYDAKVTKAKREWLAKHLPSVKFDNIYIVPYGTPKHTIANGILFDDEERNRIAWTGVAYRETQIFEFFKEI